MWGHSIDVDDERVCEFSFLFGFNLRYFEDLLRGEREATCDFEWDG